MSLIDFQKAVSEHHSAEWYSVFNPGHLLAMTDDTGMFQHSRFFIPDRRHGYTLDDNVRAMLVAAQSKDPIVMAQLPVYLGFVMYCQQAGGEFINFMAYDRHFLEKVGSPDSHGRTMWTLGRVYLEKPVYRPVLEPVLTALRPHIVALTSPRALAFSILGLHAYGLAFSTQRAVADSSRSELLKLAESLLKYWEAHQQPGWHWFEENITYENARLPQALFAAYNASGQPRFLAVARQAADFLSELHFKSGYLKLIGNSGWLKRGQTPAGFDEQPVDAGALVEMYVLAYETTNEPAYKELALRALSWYKGENCHGLAMYNPLTGGCYDGLEAKGVNYNQGAESVLSFALAQQSIVRLTGSASRD